MKFEHALFRVSWSLFRVPIKRHQIEGFTPAGVASPRERIRNMDYFEVYIDFCIYTALKLSNGISKTRFAKLLSHSKEVSMQSIFTATGTLQNAPELLTRYV